MPVPLILQQSGFGSPSEVASWEGLRDFTRSKGRDANLSRDANLVGMDYESYAALSSEERQRLLDEALADPYGLANEEGIPDPAKTPDSISDNLKKDGVDYDSLDREQKREVGNALYGPQPEEVTRGGPEFGDPPLEDPTSRNPTSTNPPPRDPPPRDAKYVTLADLQELETGQTTRTSMPRGPGGLRIGTNTTIRTGPIFTGGAALAISNNDDDETTVPLSLPGDDDMNDPTTTTTPTYTLDPMGRIIPSSMAEGGTLQELGGFGDVYSANIPSFVQQMAGVTGAGQTAYAQEVLGMEGDKIGAYDIGKETSRQQRGLLGDLLGLGPDATYADIIAAGTAPMQGLSQVRQTVLPGLQSAFQTAQERLEQGLTGRERQQVEQATRARFGALGRGADTAALATEIGDIMQEERGLYSQNLQDALGIAQTTSNIGQQEAYATSPFTQAAIGSADLGPGLALAADIGRQAAAATPTPTDIFGLEAGERQFSLDQQALQEAGKAGRFDVLGSILSAGASAFRGGPYAGLQQQALGTPPYFPQQFQQGDQYRFPLGG